MRILRAFALGVNGLWALLWLALAAAAIANQAAGIVPAALALGAVAVLSAFVIVKDARGERAAKPQRILAVILNAGLLALATVGWSTALTGGPGPTNVGGALAAVLLTVMVVLNLILMLRPGLRPPVAAAPGT